MTIEKPAETGTPIHELIGRRWSSRAFADRPVEPEKLRSIFEAARWAPSSRNEQPWAFLYATRDEPENFERLAGTLMSSNHIWAQKAPVLILALVHNLLSKDGTPNRLALHDLGLATSNLITQATALGLTTHQMGGFNAETARERFHVPPDWDPISVIALAYPGDPDALPEKFRERETAQRRRKPLSEFIFSETWGNPASIVGQTQDKTQDKTEDK